MKDDTLDDVEEVIGLQDLDVSEDYLSKRIESEKQTTAQLRNYRIPKKGEGGSQSSLESTLDSSGSSEDTGPSFSGGMFKCFECGVRKFPNRNALDLHIVSVHNSASGGLFPSSKESHTCHQCNLQFDTRNELNNHVQEHYSPSRVEVSRPKPASNKPMLKCPLCKDYFSEMTVMMDHLKRRHENGRADKSDSYSCSKCKKKFENRRRFEEHSNIDHKYKCNHCNRCYILEVDLNHHVEKAHKSGKAPSWKGFTCRYCGEAFGDMETFKMHQLKPHTAACYVGSCPRKYLTKAMLVQHLKNSHNVLQIKVGAEERVSLTLERSKENEDIAEWAENWIKSPLAVEHMLKVMRGQVKSRRHDLFLDKRERDHCCGSETSRLYKLSNPGFLGGHGEKDTAVIKQLIESVFIRYFESAEPNLKSLGKDNTAFVYTSCVLFPETFIHQHQCQGKSREEAERAFMEVAVDLEERMGLSLEIREAAAASRKRVEGAGGEDSGDEWVDHSDISDSET